MSFVMTTRHTVMCSHGGRATATLPDVRVKVAGAPVVTQPTPYVIVGCPYPAQSGGTMPPCVTASWVRGATRVRSMGQPLLLTSCKGITAPNGVPTRVLPGQTRVRGT